MKVLWTCNHLMKKKMSVKYCKLKRFDSLHEMPNSILEEKKKTKPLCRLLNLHRLLTLVLLNTDIPRLANSVDPDQFASEEAN